MGASARLAWGFGIVLAACGADDPPDSEDAGSACELPLALTAGDSGHPDPLSLGPGEVRAGRIRADQFPVALSATAVWRDGDFVLANDRIAMVIEDVGPSDLYDPWGGRPVGIARVEYGELVDPTDFGEFLILTGRESVVTQSVTVLNDGSDGEAAVVRAAGFPSPTPFFESITGGFFRERHRDIPTAIDYVLEPGAEHIDVYVVHNSGRIADYEWHIILHGFLFTKRTPTFAPGVGFETGDVDVPYLAFIDDDATSYSYERPDGLLTPGISTSGFRSRFGGSFVIEACAQTRRHHARITVGGPGLDGLRAAIARTKGDELVEVTGSVRDHLGDPAVGVRVFAHDDEEGFITRTRTDADGQFSLRVPAAETTVLLTAYRKGDEVVGPSSVEVGTGPADLTLAPTGAISVTAVESGSERELPARIQVLPVDQAIPGVPGHFGEVQTASGRLHVEFPTDGRATMSAPVGTWEVIVSRGYEYEIYREQVEVLAGETVSVRAELDHVIDTTGVMCADYHIHTIRSNDSGDPAELKVRSAAADGLDLPIRSDHEFVEGFQPVVEELGLEEWLRGMTSVESTTMELWGHFGLFPLEHDPDAVNGGAPLWQRYPTVASPDVYLESLTAPEVWAAVRERPEQPIVIVNHPRGDLNYFDHVGYDPVTGTVENEAEWDEDFKVVEIFNSSGWRRNRAGSVTDWLSFLDRGRRVFAVGSSDSHHVSGSPVGYPRTCLRLGTDDPMTVTPGQVRDATAAGRSVIVGGIYVDASVGGHGPGDTATGVGETALVEVRVRAAGWIDVTGVEIVVDGQPVESFAVLPEDTDPEDPVGRWEAQLEIPVAEGRGSYVIAVAYGDRELDPVHPGRSAFGVTNPIFIQR